MVDVWVQCVQERLRHVRNEIMPHFYPENFHFYCDQHREGVMPSFMKLLEKASENEWILYLQDDVIIADGLHDYIEDIIDHAKELNTEFISLYGSSKGEYLEALKNGIKYVPIKNYYGLCGALISKRLMKLAIEKFNERPYEPVTNGWANPAYRCSDMYLGWVMKQENITPYIHIPCLVQHTLHMKSSIGTRQTWNRKSNTFDKKYITNMDWKKLYYSSALKFNKHMDSPFKGVCSFVRDTENIAFKWDVSKADKIIATYEVCDVFYTEPPWLSGIKVFNERAGVDNSANEYYQGLTNVILSIKDKPVYITAGKSFNKRIPEPQWKRSVRLNNTDAEIWGYNCTELMSPKDDMNLDFIKSLSRIYNVVGDFNCGYGNTGRIFKENGKRFVMSDYDANCIYHIEKTLFENNTD